MDAPLSSTPLSSTAIDWSTLMLIAATVAATIAITLAFSPRSPVAHPAAVALANGPGGSRASSRARKTVEGRLDSARMAAALAATAAERSARHAAEAKAKVDSLLREQARQRPPRSRTGHRIAMVSDFFPPNLGGVELHQFYLAQCLLARGHKVIVITHSYAGRVGVRWMSNGLKVYYLPNRPIYNGVTLPTLGLVTFPLVRNILLRERIEIVHSHQAFSPMGHEGIIFARTLGLRAVFTDHSLFGFADASSILTNKLLKFSLSDVNHAICVSHTSRENTCLRAAIEPSRVSVIPNAVDSSRFTPDPSSRDADYITIVVISRLVYRKGIDLLLPVIPALCAAHPRVRFVIGGDGPKRLVLEEMRERYRLEDRVELLGAVPHTSVRDVLCRGDIFLNVSLTEAFCMAIVEAACCGLLVVSTSVGGVPEVLPEHMTILATPDAPDILDALQRALHRYKQVDARKQHAEVASLYNWHDIARRTELVYSRVKTEPNTPLLERFRRYFGSGPFIGILNIAVVSVMYLYAIFLEWYDPRDQIDVAPDFPRGGEEAGGGLDPERLAEFRALFD